MHRYYDPNLGRFISEDPAKDGLNWYIYTANNPLKFIDPTGLYTDYSDPSGPPTHHDSPDDFSPKDDGGGGGPGPGGGKGPNQEKALSRFRQWQENLKQMWYDSRVKHGADPLAAYGAVYGAQALNKLIREFWDIKEELDALRQKLYEAKGKDVVLFFGGNTQQTTSFYKRDKDPDKDVYLIPEYLEIFGKDGRNAVWENFHWGKGLDPITKTRDALIMGARAEYIGAILNEYFAREGNTEKELIIVGFSQGGDFARVLTNKVDKTIDWLVTISTPGRKDMRVDESKINKKHYINIYSFGDSVTWGAGNRNRSSPDRYGNFIDDAAGWNVPYYVDTDTNVNVTLDIGGCLIDISEISAGIYTHLQGVKQTGLLKDTVNTILGK